MKLDIGVKSNKEVLFEIQSDRHLLIYDRSEIFHFESHRLVTDFGIHEYLIGEISVLDQALNFYIDLLLKVFSLYLRGLLLLSSSSSPTKL